MVKRTFTMATRNGPEERSYIAEFQWGGETFVVNRALEDTAWRASHKDTGFGFGKFHATWEECKEAAIAFLEVKGEKALKAAIRRARRQIKKEHMK